jgi:hypothetical protein
VQGVWRADVDDVDRVVCEQLIQVVECASDAEEFS